MQSKNNAAQRLSHELREGKDSFLRARRVIVGLSLMAEGALAMVSLYQVGMIRHVPEPPLPRMNADKVDASAEAYELFRMPDAILGLGSYTVTAGLAAMGGKDRHRSRPWIPIMLALKLGFDAFNAGRLTLDQWKRHRAFCFWCLLAASATFVMSPLGIPEAIAAFRSLGSGKRQNSGSNRRR